MSGKQTIILLDLNYTLVENSDVKKSPFLRQIEGEVYRAWLVKLCRDYLTLMLTARPGKYHVPTLDSLQRKTGWQPDGAFFNTQGLPPPQAKEYAMRQHVLPRYGAADYVAIESNPRTREMFNREFKIESFTHAQVAEGKGGLL